MTGNFPRKRSRRRKAARHSGASELHKQGDHSRRTHHRSDGPAPVGYGALDLGTNNCRLLVAKPAPWGFRVIDAFSRIVRLGEGLQHTGELSAMAMFRRIRLHTGFFHKQCSSLQCAVKMSFLRRHQFHILRFPPRRSAARRAAHGLQWAGCASRNPTETFQRKSQIHDFSRIGRTKRKGC